MIYEFILRSKEIENNFYENGETFTSFVSYSINKRKRWIIYDPLNFNQWSRLKIPLIISIRNVNNYYGTHFTSYEEESFCYRNILKLSIEGKKTCQINTHGFFNLRSLTIERQFHSRNTEIKVKVFGLRKRKDHKPLLNKYTQEVCKTCNTKVEEETNIEFLQDTNNVMRPKKVKQDRSKLKRLKKLLIKQEIQEDLEDYYAERGLCTSQFFVAEVNKMKDFQYDLEFNNPIADPILRNEIYEDAIDISKIYKMTPSHDARPYTSRELQILLGKVLSSAFLKLFDERPKDPISRLANILYNSVEDESIATVLFKDQLFTISNL